MNPMARLSLSVVALVTGVPLAHADAAAPLRPAQVIALPGVEKRIDHLAVDVGGQRLFVAALGNGTLEVIDLKAGKRVRSVPGLKEPQGVAYLPDLHKVVVANGGGSVVAFEDSSFRPLVTLDGIEDADNLRFDAAARQLYVGYGDGALGIIDPATMKRLGDIKLPGHPESFRLEQGSPRVYVNVPTTREVLVVDRQKRTIVSHVPLGGLAKNYPMSLDEAHHRLFVGTRQPPRVLVLDTQSGRRITDVPCVGDTDDLFYDSQRDRLYVIGGEGFVDVFDTSAPGRYQRLAHLPTAAGARTGLWVPELHRLFVAAPHRGGQEAAIHVFEAPAETAAERTATPR
jgi:DNA-binding beta-propeller fold protein YncE